MKGLSVGGWGRNKKICKILPGRTRDAKSIGPNDAEGAALGDTSRKQTAAFRSITKKRLRNDKARIQWVKGLGGGETTGKGRAEGYLPPKRIFRKLDRTQYGWTNTITNDMIGENKTGAENGGSESSRERGDECAGVPEKNAELTERPFLGYGSALFTIPRGQEKGEHAKKTLMWKLGLLAVDRFWVGMVTTKA